MVYKNEKGIITAGRKPLTEEEKQKNRNLLAAFERVFGKKDTNRAESEIIKLHRQSGWGVPVSHTCKDGDFESTANCPACKWLREHGEASE